MQTISVPYGRGMMSAKLPEKALLGVFESGVPQAAPDPAKEVEDALDHPIGSERLETLAAGKRTAVVIASDHTRPVPNRILLPALLARLRRGAPDIGVTILVATGCHRGTTRAELAEMYGENIVEQERIVVHDCDDEANLVHLGTLPSGGALVVNRLVAEADLVIAAGFIEPHFFAGFSGGRKSILPGVASRQTVLANHCSEFIQSPFARTGILEGNPIHRDMLYAAERARLAFILNVVIDPGKRIVRAFAGDSIAAHEAGCAFLRGCCGVAAPEADIVVTSNGGHPLDQNVYQSVKGMTAGEAVCRDGGVIILSAACTDGHGGDEFFSALSGAASPEVLWNTVAGVPRDRTVPDQWQYQILCRILLRHTVILVTRDYDHAAVRAMHMEVASTLQEALEMAFQKVGPEAKVAVLPDGVSVIASRRKSSFCAKG